MLCGRGQRTTQEIPRRVYERATAKVARVCPSVSKTSIDPLGDLLELANIADTSAWFTFGQKLRTLLVPDSAHRDKKGRSLSVSQQGSLGDGLPRP